MYVRKNVKKTKRFRHNVMLTESEAFVHPVEINKAQSVN